jgi:hypothetical protein
LALSKRLLRTDIGLEPGPVSVLHLVLQSEVSTGHLLELALACAKTVSWSHILACLDACNAIALGPLLERYMQGDRHATAGAIQMRLAVACERHCSISRDDRAEALLRAFLTVVGPSCSEAQLKSLAVSMPNATVRVWAAVLPFCSWYRADSTFGFLWLLGIALQTQTAALIEYLCAHTPPAAAGAWTTDLFRLLRREEELPSLSVFAALADLIGQDADEPPADGTLLHVLACAMVQDGESVFSSHHRERTAAVVRALVVGGVPLDATLQCRRAPGLDTLTAFGMSMLVLPPLHGLAEVLMQCGCDLNTVRMSSLRLTGTELAWLAMAGSSLGSMRMLSAFPFGAIVGQQPWRCPPSVPPPLRDVVLRGCRAFGSAPASMHCSVDGACVVFSVSPVAFGVLDTATGQCEMRELSPGCEGPLVLLEPGVVVYKAAAGVCFRALDPGEPAAELLPLDLSYDPAGPQLQVTPDARFALCDLRGGGFAFVGADRTVLPCLFGGDVPVAVLLDRQLLPPVAAGVTAVGALLVRLDGLVSRGVFLLDTAARAAAFQLDFDVWVDRSVVPSLSSAALWAGRIVSDATVFELSRTGVSALAVLPTLQTPHNDLVRMQVSTSGVLSLQTLFGTHVAHLDRPGRSLYFPCAATVLVPCRNELLALQAFDSRWLGFESDILLPRLLTFPLDQLHWRPDNHSGFAPSFRRAVRALLLARARAVALSADAPGLDSLPMDVVLLLIEEMSGHAWE